MQVYLLTAAGDYAAIHSIAQAFFGGDAQREASQLCYAPREFPMEGVLSYIVAAKSEHTARNLAAADAREIVLRSDDIGMHLNPEHWKHKLKAPGKHLGRHDGEEGILLRIFGLHQD